MLLRQFGLKNPKAAETAYKLSDGGGLRLPIKPNGARLWRMKCRFEAKRAMRSTLNKNKWLLEEVAAPLPATKFDATKRILAGAARRSGACFF